MVYSTSDDWSFGTKSYVEFLDHQFSCVNFLVVIEIEGRKYLSNTKVFKRFEGYKQEREGESFVSRQIE